MFVFEKLELKCKTLDDVLKELYSKYLNKTWHVNEYGILNFYVNSHGQIIMHHCDGNSQYWVNVNEIEFNTKNDINDFDTNTFEPELIREVSPIHKSCNEFRCCTECVYHLYDLRAITSDKQKDISYDMFVNLVVALCEARGEYGGKIMEITRINEDTHLVDWRLHFDD